MLSWKTEGLKTGDGSEIRYFKWISVLLLKNYFKCIDCTVVRFLILILLCCYAVLPLSLVSGISLQRNGGLFGNHVNHVGDEQGTAHPTTVTQRPLQILPFSCSASFEPTQTGRRASSNDRERETEMNSSPIQYNHHYHPPHPRNYPNCNSTCHQSPIPSNANLNNANVPSLLSMTNGRQQKCLLRRDRTSSIKNASSVSTYSKAVHEKPWKSHSTRSVHWKLQVILKWTTKTASIIVIITFVCSLEIPTSILFCVNQSCHRSSVYDSYDWIVSWWYDCIVLQIHSIVHVINSKQTPNINKISCRRFCFLTIHNIEMQPTALKNVLKTLYTAQKN